MADATAKDLEQDKQIDQLRVGVDAAYKAVVNLEERIDKIEKQLKALEPFSNFMARWLSGSGGVT